MLLLLAGCVRAPVTEPFIEQGNRLDSTSDTPMTLVSIPPSLQQPSEQPPGQVPPGVTTDLWVRLRASFSLRYSAPDSALLKKMERQYTHQQYFERLSERAYWYMPYILDQIEARGMPAELALLPAVESAYRPEAVSRSRAVGLWQFIGATAKRFGLRRDWWLDERKDVVHSTRAALDYLAFLAAEFDGDWELALAAYNAGEGTIRAAIKRNRAAGKPTGYTHLKLRRETREYVPRLFALRNIISRPEQYGIVLKPVPNRNTIAVVEVGTQTDLAIAAAQIPLSAAELGQLNQGYRRGTTPPGGPHHLVVPTQYATALSNGLNLLAPQKRLQWNRHRVRKGEYLGHIAQQHGVSVAAIKTVNGLRSDLIRIGQELKIPLSAQPRQYARTAADNIEIINGDTIYTVKKGNNLWQISRLSGVSIDNLLRWNSLARDDILQPGQQLVIGRAP